LDKNKKKRKKNVCVFYESINKIGGAGWAVLAGRLIPRVVWDSSRKWWWWLHVGQRSVEEVVRDRIYARLEIRKKKRKKRIEWRRNVVYT
jgi:hypothetical protein